MQAYRHVHDVFRAVSSRFRFDWNGTRNLLKGQIGAYPGDAYVDIIGLDVYDKGLPVAWSSTTKSWADPAAAWNWILPHLAFQRDFALAHGKQVSFPEWALASGGTQSSTSAGGDDPTFIQGMYDWMNALPTTGSASLAYQSYFNYYAAGDGDHALSVFPNSQQRYRSLFGATAAPASTAAPVTTTTPTTTPVTTTIPVATTVPARRRFRRRRRFRQRRRPSRRHRQPPPHPRSSGCLVRRHLRPRPRRSAVVVPGVSDSFAGKAVADARRGPIRTRLATPTPG